MSPFAERWWHFGRHPRCGLRYSDWFWWPKVGRYCWPCWNRRAATEKNNV